MPDYYDQLETQLVALTNRGAHRRRRPRIALPPPRLGLELVAVAAAVLIVVVVATAILSVGTAHHGPRHHTSPATHTSTSRVLLNQYPARLPAAPGRFICQSPLRAPRGSRSTHGIVRFYAAPPTGTTMLLTAGGLPRSIGQGLYAVWLYPAVSKAEGGYQLQWSHSPQLVGVIESPAGVSGHVTIAHRLAQTFNGAYKLVVTVQPHGSLRAPGRIALAGFIDF